MAPKIQRHEHIVGLVRRNGFMPIEELARELDVTPQTIRRDINQLCESGLLRRYHGGAAISDPLAHDTFLVQKSRSQNEKSRLADLIAARIPDGASLFMSIGTTIEAVAAALAKTRSQLRIITNNIHVAALLSGRPDYTVIITSGVVRPLDGGITGVATVDFINQFKADYAVLSAASAENDGSLLDFDFKEVSVMQAMMHNARHRCLALDHSKTGRSALVRIGDITEFHTIFTDQTLPAALQKKLTDAGIPCHTAAPDNS
ncbi:DeoR/GlpR family DNA-binding transcription regulator [Neisseria leonii]|uniref:DeoR/GlpR family DNA-binding transcription regulator n=1 Tax=Neisseria leonii TaxID=2995413 RepID=A0A9X4IAN3_9NEIS|nr:DeoR/GlpR family DNA-binding transcription regulator [Neisseria sp. 51.81]MDD9327549.1 DeoR/GlpR family DNA-binding transcription regulator [Neisseria sp. 51.81]